MPRQIARYILTLLASGAGLAVCIILLAPQVKALATSGHAGKPDATQLKQPAERSVVVDRTGKTLAVIHEEQNRSDVAFNKIPSSVISAVLDTEDDRFYQHGGIDLRSTVRALATDVSGGKLAQGGSTITQQLVKNSDLTPEKTFGRKFKEAVLAVRLEQQLSKQEILRRYLNTVYFGNHAYGVQAAAETYFNEDVSQLTVGQAALLAGMIQDPLGYDPIRNPTAARTRLGVVLDRMVTAHDLTRAAADRLHDEALPTQLAQPAPLPKDYFVEDVRTQLEDTTSYLPGTQQERQNAVNEGGLRIVTTLDPRLQAAALTARSSILPNTNGKFTAAVVTLDSNGAVRALVGGDSFEESQYDIATHLPGRQPGSSFKPFVLATALDEGYSPNDSINGASPCEVKAPGQAPYKLENFEGEAGGVVSITDATAHSINCAYVKLSVLVGLDKVEAMAHKLGIPDDVTIHPYSSEALGTSEVPPIDMASAYSTFADDGVHHDPYFIDKIYDRNGKLIYQHRDHGQRKISAQLARVETQVLRTVVQYGTGTAANVSGHQVAGKTGTTENRVDAWFVGYTPQLTTAVWMGAPVADVPMTDVGGISVQGGAYPARIWGAYMKAALAPMPSVPFPTPDPSQIGAGHVLDTSKISTDVTTTTATSSTTTSPSTTSAVSTTVPEIDTLPGPPDTRPPRTTLTTEPGTPPTTRRRRGGGGG